MNAFIEVSDSPYTTPFPLQKRREGQGAKEGGKRRAKQSRSIKVSME